MPLVVVVVGWLAVFDGAGDQFHDLMNLLPPNQGGGCWEAVGLLAKNPYK